MIVNIKNSLILFCIILCYSCNKKEQYYYYAFYTNADSLPEAYIIKDVKNNEYRKEIDFMFSANGVFKSKSGNIFKVTNVGLKKQEKQHDIDEYKPYLNIDTNGYVNFKYSNESLNDFASTSFCFLGAEDIAVNNKKYTGAYRFRKRQGSVNTVSSIVYFDRDFIPILEEFEEGERPYYKIERIDTVLSFKIK